MTTKYVLLLLNFTSESWIFAALESTYSDHANYKICKLTIQHLIIPLSRLYRDYLSSEWHLTRAGRHDKIRGCDARLIRTPVAIDVRHRPFSPFCCQIMSPFNAPILISHLDDTYHYDRTKFLPNVEQYWNSYKLWQII